MVETLFPVAVFATLHMQMILEKFSVPSEIVIELLYYVGSKNRVGAPRVG